MRDSNETIDWRAPKGRWTPSQERARKFLDEYHRVTPVKNWKVSFFRLPSIDSSRRLQPMDLVTWAQLDGHRFFGLVMGVGAKGWLGPWSHLYVTVQEISPTLTQEEAIKQFANPCAVRLCVPTGIISERLLGFEWCDAFVNVGF